MQITFKDEHASSHRKVLKNVAADIQAFAPVTSRTGASGIPAASAPVHKGRVTTPPPAAAMGLHQLMLEAFWLD